MKITKKSEYALRALIQIALNDNGGVIRAKDIADKENMSVKFLEQVCWRFLATLATTRPICNLSLLRHKSKASLK
jgi:DNA-binding IscR family transcriptional regulator